MKTGSEGQGNSAGVLPLRADDFASRIGRTIPLGLGGAEMALTIALIEELPHARREGGGFRIEFTGPRETALPQGTYPFMLDGAPHDIFIVPLAPDTGGAAVYEAVFL